MGYAQPSTAELSQLPPLPPKDQTVNCSYFESHLVSAKLTISAIVKVAIDIWETNRYLCSKLDLVK